MLTRTERTILANQLRILQKLYPDEADWLEEQRQAVVAGYEMHYGDLLVSPEPAMTEAESREACDILSMYAALGIEFPGYDGNDRVEFRYMMYVDYQLNFLGHYEYLGQSEQGHINSHTPMLDKYRRMLAIYKKVPPASRAHLNQELIEKISNA